MKLGNIIKDAAGGFGRQWFGKMSGMLSLGRLVSLATFGGTIASAAAIHRLLTHVIGIVMLAVITSLMIALLFTVGLYVAYQAGILYGMTSFESLMLVYALTLILTGALIYVLVTRLKGLKTLPDLMMFNEVPVVDKVQNIAHSFMDGLKTPKKPKNTFDD